jgi:hypothetical protein
MVDNDNERLRSSSGLSSDILKGQWLYPTSGNEAGNTRFITSSTPTSGTITHGLAWGTGMGSGNTYEVLRFHPDDIHASIDHALRKMQRWEWYPLSLLNDPAMEESGVASGAADRDNSNATPTKDTDAADGAGVLGGAQSLQVVTSSTNGYSREATHIDAQSGAAYWLWAMAKADGAFTATIWVHDETNDSAIDNVTWAHNDWGIVTLGFNAPTACDSISIRLGAAETSATVHFDNVIVRKSGRAIYNLPSWVQAPEADVEGLFAFTGDTAFDLDIKRRAIATTYHDPAAANPRAIAVDSGTSSEPLFIKAARSFLAATGTLSADTTESTAPIEWVTPVAINDLFDGIVGTAPGVDISEWAALRRSWALRAKVMNARYAPTSEPEAVKVNWRE